ncbi:hypothetical protein Sjap_001504 [Stephania japonica]|uniref:Uncharacterized protein n=1 Tax=Stephania japonica TaxID=461633 RepID=A0AAP0KLT9_9MAGN
MEWKDSVVCLIGPPNDGPSFRTHFPLPLPIPKPKVSHIPLFFFNSEFHIFSLNSHLFCFNFSRFDRGTLRILHSILASQHSARESEIRQNLIRFIRSQAKLVVEEEIADKSVEEKLLVLEFLVRAFALCGDVQSCLALRYEALILRHRECVSRSLDWLQVECGEWLAFAKDSLQNGYHAVAVQVCENALKSVQINHRSDSYDASARLVDQVKELKDVAVELVASHSVQAQATKYLKNKKRREMQQDGKLDSEESKNSQASASSVFRDGIKTRNRHQLIRLQSSTKTESITPN